MNGQELIDQPKAPESELGSKADAKDDLKSLSYFWGPIPWTIEAAVILSAVARHWPDFGIILLQLVANAVVGFWEEHEAGNPIAALKAKLATKARVKRDGKWITPPADLAIERIGDLLNDEFNILPGATKAGCMQQEAS